MKPKEKAFEKWFDEYFCDQQCEDSPYRYVDVRNAFFIGYKRALKAQAEEIFREIEKLCLVMPKLSPQFKMLKKNYGVEE